MRSYELLTVGNPKTRKGEQASGVLTGVLHLAPHTLSGRNVCPFAEKAGCAGPCLNTAGRGGIVKKGETSNAIQRARVRRTVMLFEQREEFMAALARDIERLRKDAEKHKLEPAVRLNGTSDLPWHTLARGLMDANQDVVFYDYTKVHKRRGEALPTNCHLTFSAFPGMLVSVEEFTSQGLNVAVVFRVKRGHPLPDTYQGVTVIDGDLTDYRPGDPKGVVVGLRAKGKAIKDTSGFVVEVA